jgi:hypothetical protein
MIKLVLASGDWTPRSRGSSYFASLKFVKAYEPRTPRIDPLRNMVVAEDPGFGLMYREKLL